jgi:NADPH-dependent 7-cyano-7-deazaguanine reductase QueF-like protein
MMMFLPVLGGYGISVQNWVKYQLVLSLRTGGVPSGGISEIILIPQGINLVGTSSFKTRLLKIYIYSYSGSYIDNFGSSSYLSLG